jgi:hypothetical protein
MATVTPNFNWPVPTSTDLVKDGATAIEALGDSIDASMVDLKGGTTGQVLSKASNTDMDFTWVTDTAGDITGVTAGTGISGGGTSGTVTVTNSMATAIDAKGDLVPGTGADTFARLPVGTNGQVLTADSAEATGLKWATSTSGSMTLLHTITLSTTSHTQSSISQSYKNLYVVGQNLGAASGAALRIRCAGRTGGYIYSYITKNAIAAGADGGFDGVSNDLGGTGGSACQFTFYDYAETNSEKLVMGQMVGNLTGDVTLCAGSPFNLQTNISSITITTVGGSVNLSGTILIYGVN